MPRPLVAVLAVLTLVGRALAQTPSDDVVLPSVEQVMKDMRVTGELESAARGEAALKILASLLTADGAKGKEKGEYLAAAKTLVTGRDAATSRHAHQVASCAGVYNENAFTREIIERYFTAAWKESAFPYMKAAKDAAWRKVAELPADTRFDPRTEGERWERFCAPSAQRREEAARLAAAPLPTPPRLLVRDEPVIEVSAQALYREFSSNQIAAEKKYRGRFRVKGKVLTVRRDEWPSQEVTVWLQTSANDSSVGCTLIFGRTQQAEAVKAGSNVTCSCGFVRLERSSTAMGTYITWVRLGCDDVK